MYLSDRQVAQRYSVSRGTPWRWAKTDSTFPKPVELTPGCTRWRLMDLENWEQNKAEVQSYDKE
ncbi:AlpA family phage regulatory protein [Lutimaribacter saemankumensis]|uniref:helix-turn-helix transcriptional regulator n=1 Tax=Lutimaribacter saemankumensis TaxID=490829 RepID=UPI000B7E69C2